MPDLDRQIKDWVPSPTRRRN